MELTGDETICVARHLIVQHRQAVFHRKSHMTEACENCPIVNKCYKKLEHNEIEIWSSIYKKICGEAGHKCSFAINLYPLVPYGKEGSQ